MKLVRNFENHPIINASAAIAMIAFKKKLVSGKINLAELGAAAGGAILGTALGKVNLEDIT